MAHSSLFSWVLLLALSCQGLNASLAVNSYTPVTRPNFGPDIPHRVYLHQMEQEEDNVEPFIFVNSVAQDTITTQQAQRVALSYLVSQTQLHPQHIQVKNIYQTDHNQVTHIHVQQVVQGIPIVNAVANINVDRHGHILSFGSTLYPIQQDSKLGAFFKHKNTIKYAHDSFKHTMQDERIKLSPAAALSQLAQFIHIELAHETIVETPMLTTQAMGTASSSPSFLLEGVPFAVKGQVPASLAYIQVTTDTGVELKLVWDLQVEMQDNWFHAHVDTETGEVHHVVDWVSDAAYHVFSLGINDPLSGNRTLVKNPAHSIASPRGWHQQTSKNYTVTIGNNVYAHENLDGKYTWEDNYRPDGTDALLFDFAFNELKEPSTYIDAAVTNLFYWNNMIHDLFYVYGFDEKAGNFQQNNLDKGGLEGDAVIANAQDGSGFNNANFATPPDGQHGKMRMYVWDRTKPMRDGDMEGGIVVHEYAHGISTRLTGGPSNSGCLGWGESGGMGEGWGDFFATILRHTRQTKRTQNYGMGEYANGGSGIRRYLYSSNMTTNPSTYNYITKPGYWGVHAKGEVWAVILLEVYWELVEKYGFDQDWFNIHKMANLNGDATGATFLDFQSGQRLPVQESKKRGSNPDSDDDLAGNLLALQLVVDGLKLQPCYPTFVDARDAILQADVAGFRGKHLCDLWKGFAKRGLGFGARSGGRESFNVPRKCRPPAPAPQEKEQQEEAANTEL